MAGLSRRAFLAASAGLGAALGVPQQALAQRLADPLTPSAIPTTLDQTTLLITAATTTGIIDDSAPAPESHTSLRYDGLEKAADAGLVNLVGAS